MLRVMEGSLRSVAAAAALMAATALAGCGQSGGASPSTQKTDRSPSAFASALVSLPAEGIVESGDGKVVVRRLDGSLATELASMRLDGRGSPARPPRLLARDGQAFRLSHRQLVPDPSARGDEAPSGPVSPPAMPAPAGAGIGHWRYAFPAGGAPALAQWSGECEIPTAYEIVGGRPGGLGTSGAPVESEALGLSMSGEPVVQFLKSACGDRDSGRVGVYVRSAVGDWRRVTASESARYFRA